VSGTRLDRRRGLPVDRDAAFGFATKRTVLPTSRMLPLSRRARGLSSRSAFDFALPNVFLPSFSQNRPESVKPPVSLVRRARRFACQASTSARSLAASAALALEATNSAAAAMASDTALTDWCIPTSYPISEAA